MINLAQYSLGEKLLYTGFLLLMGVGYLMALAYLYTNHAGYDGKSGWRALTCGASSAKKLPPPTTTRVFS